MASRAAKLKELRELKRLGRKRGGTAYQDASEATEDIYDEVDDEGMRKIMRERLNEDDFVVDDNGAGYVDNGQDDFEDRASDSGDEEPRSKAQKQKTKKSVTGTRGEAPISKFFQHRAMVVPTGQSENRQQRPAVKQQEDQDFMASILAGVAATGGGVLDVSSTRNKRGPQNEHVRPRKRYSSPPLRNVINNPHAALFDTDQEETPAIKAPEMSSSPPAATVLKHEEDFDMPALPDSRSNKRDVEDEDDDDEDEFSSRALRAHSGPVREAKSISSKKVKLESNLNSPPPPSSEVDVDQIDTTTWAAINETLQIASSPPPIGGSRSDTKTPIENCQQEDGSIEFFWMDYLEMGKSLYLIGKAHDRKRSEFVSCMVQVEGIMRNMYFLPREHKSGSSGNNDKVGMGDVYEEVSKLLSKAGIRDWKSKVSRRKYAFELPNIPADAEYLKVLVPYGAPQLPAELQGETFSHVFGTSTAMFEQFVLARNIMGPSWLKVTLAKPVPNASWCKLELRVDDIDNITPIDEGNRATPPLTIMSIAPRCMVNPRTSRQEIVSVSARVYSDVSLDDPAPADKMRSFAFTIIRPHDKLFPVGFEAEAARRHKGGTTLHCERTESALLASFITRLQGIDPDVIMGHQWDEVGYPIFISRMKELRTPNWHSIGRMRRSTWPKSQSSNGRSQMFVDKLIGVGRLACDLANDLGKSLIKATSWSLGEIVDLQLGVKREDMDVAKFLQSWGTSASGLMDFVKHAEADTYFIAAICINIQMLPLTKVLTNLAGNSWARTLTGTRAERNEYILLHEFHKNKYICPDKTYQRASAVSHLSTGGDDEEDNDEPKKKDKYKGGLVFEPQKGLYDKYILVMDFNSLYPSIIQEYNICFTTVQRPHGDKAGDDDAVPDPPSSEQPLGILPRLISTLVSRRRQVKSLMKDKSATAAQRLQWDIKQQALKLTANSMYGCLGYTRSRFYARPLAVLTTFKGREVLMDTKDLAESLMLQVIYGDTDSVMINTNVDSMAEAMRIGQDFKIAVNQRYQLLEIDIDHVYQRILLHAKKKYAALNVIDQGGKLVSKVDVKGLDMRRREYCALSKEASAFALDKILSGQPTDQVVETIHEYLRELSENVRAGKVPVGKFIIYNALGKNPEEYPNAKTMPHVMVALKRKAAGETIRAHDVIPYVIRPGEEHVAERACAPVQVMRSNDKTLDWTYYLAHQVLPPMERLCAPINGTDRARLAECLGLDPRRYQVVLHDSKGDRDIKPFESQMSDAERFCNAEPLMLQPGNGEPAFAFNGLCETSVTAEGIVVPDGTGRIMPFGLVAVQLVRQIRRHIDHYYNGVVLCDDAACRLRTRQISVYGRRCLGRSCHGTVRYEYSDKDLYTQLLYLYTLFDVDRAKAKQAVANEALNALAEKNRLRFQSLRNVVQGYLNKSGRRFVDLNTIFAFM